MNKISPHRLDTATLMRLGDAATPVIIQSRGVCFGVYFPCTFTDRTTPDYDDIFVAVQGIIIECERRKVNDVKG